MKLSDSSVLALILGSAAACAPVLQKPLPYAAETAPMARIGISIADTEQDVKEVTLSGRSFSDRSALEGHLLYRAAVLTKQNGFEWFTLRHLPGEAGPNSHPARTSVLFSADYAHWQPHWNYYVKGTGWQPWHPEWGARFWADEIDQKLVDRFELHAMIKMAHERAVSQTDMNFNANGVIRDFGPKSGRYPS